jgi:hypothetical protein
MYQPSCPSGAHILLQFGVSCDMSIVPGGVIGTLLLLYCASMCVEADRLGFIIDGLSIFNVINAWGNNMSHTFIGNALSVEHNPAIK